MDYTNILQLLHKHCNEFQSALEATSLIGVEPWVSLYDQIVGLKEILDQPSLLGAPNPLDNQALGQPSPIDKYGLASLVISLHENNITPVVIAKQVEGLLSISLSGTDVEAWIEQYNRAPITTKVGLSNGSIFDTQTQLQTVFDTLHNLLTEVNDQDSEYFYPAKTTKEREKLEVIKEVRQSIKDAAALSATIAQMESVENFKRIVIEEINKENPAAAQRIWKRIRAQQSMMNSLRMG